jgi:hypothetical protein
VLVDCSGFFVPGSAVLDATSCFVTDGSATALMSSSSSSSYMASQQPQASTSAAGGESQHHNSKTESHQQQQQATTWQLPLCQQQQQQHLLLIKGHLPPSTTAPDWLARRALPSHPSTSSSSSSSSSAAGRQYAANPVADVLANSPWLGAASQHGLQQMQRYVQHQDQQQRQGLQRWVNLLQQAHQEQQEHENEEGAVVHNTQQDQDQQDVRTFKIENQIQQQQQQQLPLHMLLLPVPPSPGAAAALSHPWPPQLLPGFSSQGLLGPGQGLGSGTLHKPWGVPQLLRMALTHQEPSLVLRGGTGSAQAVESLLVGGLHLCYQSSIDLSSWLLLRVCACIHSLMTMHVCGYW